MPLPLHEIASLVDGQLCGATDLEITGAATIATARPGEITLADSPKLAPQLLRSQAAAVIVPEGFEPAGIPFISVADVHEAFAKVVRHFRPQMQHRHFGVSHAANISLSAKIAPDVEVDPGANIGDHVEIGPGCVIHSGVCILDGCRIGDGVTIFPNTVLYENTLVGNRVIIHAGTVIGAYGFGYTLAGDRHKLGSQLGYVEIEDDVEIGACTAIDRGTYGPTLIGQGTKIDNHVQIAHNCRIGKHNLICAHVGIAGSATTGDYVVIAGQVGIRDHTNIGERAALGAQCGVMNDIPAGQRVLGSPAIEEKEEYRILAAMFKLPEMRKKLIELERKLAALTGNELQQSKDAA
ncbi:MAG: UDP-3-O-(3-hydroxymyristoyl)glucosamine N-acyltransferase [Pirellulaceae bacterium]|nr:UDP-3-O-(3-hydroxymyristoyl)glucosamine N-acyltransferase [Pirellulaceae bacterium]